MQTCYLICESDCAGEYHATSHIRLLRPLTHNSSSSRVKVEHGTTAPAKQYDVVVLERFWRNSITMPEAEELMTAIRRKAGYLIYTLDDNLLDIGNDQPWRKGLGLEQLECVRFFLRQADGVIVSTCPLAARVRGLNGNVAVVPNALDETLFPAEPGRPAKPDRCVFGYMGTGTHASDLMMVLEPLRRFLARHPLKVEFQLAGVTLDRRILEALSGLPVRILDLPDGLPYLPFVAWAGQNLRWDFAIAPLTDNPLNRCKSDIKYLDYSILGIPGIYSDCPAYAGTVRSGETGLLSPADPEAWFDALSSMLESEAGRRSMAETARREVMSTRILAVRAQDWTNAIDSLQEAQKQ